MIQKKSNLNYTKEDLENLLDKIPYEVFLKNEDGKYIYVNQFALDKINLKKEDIIGKTNNQLNKEYKSNHWNEIDKILLHFKDYVYTEFTTNVSDKELTYEVHKFALPKDGSEKKIIGGIAREISITQNFRNEIQKLTDNLQNNNIEKNYRSFFEETLANLCKTLDFSDINIFTYNEKKSELKFCMESNVNNNFFDKSTRIHIDAKFIDDIKRENIDGTFIKEQFLKNVVRNNEEYKNKYNVIIKPITFADKLIGVLHISTIKKGYCYEYEPFVNEICKMIGVVLVNLKYVHKINKKIIEESRKKIQEVVSADVLKTNFLANVSHEFKTPINIILNSTKLLVDITSKINTYNQEIKKMKKYLHMLRQNSYRLTRLVNNILDSSKICNGFFEIKKENCNIVYIIEDIVSSVAEYLKENDRTIIFDTDEEEVMTACDPDIIEKIMLNLLSNSLKYTSSTGKIEVELKTDWNENKIFVHVRNDGPRIERSEANKIFGRFIQNEELFTRKNEGIGIGLFLVRSLIELHGGEIWINTEVEEGAEFIFYIPIKEIESTRKNSMTISDHSSIIEKCNIEFSDIYLDY